MPAITQSQAAIALQLLADAAVEQNNDISCFEADDDAPTNEEVDSESPMFDRFYEQGGPAAIILRAQLQLQPRLSGCLI